MRGKKGRRPQGFFGETMHYDAEGKSVRNLWGEKQDSSDDD